MTIGQQTYSKYKITKLGWSKEIPVEWAERRMKYLFTPLKRPVRDDDEVITAFRDGNVTLRRNRREEGFTFALQEIGYQGVRKGDLVIHGMDGFAGAIGISDSDGKATPVYSVCIPKSTEIIPGYY
jgi:type I restriction enzyme S subunit